MKTVTSKDGTVIAYDVYGSGPALIQITGASCFRNFMPVMQDAKTFAQEFTVYSYDRRGRGDSGNTLPWSINREVEDIEALIDAAGGKAFIYGHSSGAVLALEASIRLGNKVQKAILHDASYISSEQEKPAYAIFGEKISQLIKDGKNAQAIKDFYVGIGMPKAFTFLLPLFPGWKTMKALAPTLAYDIALTSVVPPVKRAATVAVPVQIMVGEKTPPVLHAVGEQLHRAIPGAEAVELKGQDHMASTRSVMPFLTSFLKK